MKLSWDTDHNSEDVRKEMVDLGFEENNDILGDEGEPDV